MAVTLPTIQIANDTLANRALAAFNSDPAEYRAWLRSALVEEVVRRENLVLREQMANKRQEFSEILNG